MTILLPQCEIGKRLGEGGFSDVHLLTHSDTSKTFALKETDLSSLSPAKLQCLKSEFVLLKSFSCVNIVRCYRSYTYKDGTKVRGILELCKYSLRTLLYKLKCEKKYLRNKRMLDVLTGISNGMNYIHERGIVHRDIKPDNILINDDDVVKLADFGLAKQIVGAEKLNDKFGTPVYMAPEMHNGQGYSFGVDVWAYGLTVYEIVTYEHPFDNVGNLKEYFKNSSPAPALPNIRPYLGKLCSKYDNVRSLTYRCLYYDPRKRLDAKTIMSKLRKYRTKWFI